MRIRSWIDEPTTFDTRETWERHLQEVTALPKDDISRAPMIRWAKKVLATKDAEAKEAQSEAAG